MPGNTPHHTKKWRDCVDKVKEKNPTANAYAICTAALGPSTLSDNEADPTLNDPPFVWNGSGALGKPFKLRASVDQQKSLAFEVDSVSLTSDAAYKAWHSRGGKHRKGDPTVTKKVGDLKRGEEIVDDKSGHPIMKIEQVGESGMAGEHVASGIAGPAHGKFAAPGSPITSMLGKPNSTVKVSAMTEHHRPRSKVNEHKPENVHKAIRSITRR